VRYGGNTSCIEVRCGEWGFIFDAGTGLRGLGMAVPVDRPLDVDLFFTHTHYDHVCGLPFFAPAFRPGNKVRLWEGHLGSGMALRDVLQQIMSAPLFPVPIAVIEAVCGFHKFSAGQTLAPRPGVSLRTAPLNHPNGAVGYRIEFGGRSACIITDTEHPPDGRDPTVLDLVRDADLMIYDSTYTDAEYPAHRGWGHSTWQEACRLAEAARVRTAVIFHHDPSHSDSVMDEIAAAAEATRPGTLVAREGMTLHL
jgi:phosphoribosyl 1,2-cyclic phosphodiesterase